VPAALTPLIGREEEVRAVVSLIAERRLVTLVGAPGIGKTRLGTEVAAAVAGSTDGTWFVDLAPVVDQALVPQAVAATLGVREEPGRALPETLAAHLADRRCLIVLDNCEHLMDAVAGLVEGLLVRCAELSILATSRETLGITGETTWRVPALGVPHPDHPGDVPASVQLFCERARAISPEFLSELSPTSLTAIGEICRRLDGVPLAIELAAARVDTMSPAQLAERLGDRFELLSVGSRTALPRQQTLRGALDWSHDLLTPPERALLRRASVFAGGWTAEAAEDVCCDELVDPRTLGEVLAGLVTKSLVVRDTGDGQPRFRLLETIRQFAHDRLGDAGESFEFAARHATWCVWLAERGERRIQGVDYPAAIEALEIEHDNVRAALRWGLTQGQTEVALRLAASMAMFWGARCYFSEGREWLLAAAGAPHGNRSALHAATLWGQGYLASLAGDYLAARDRARDSLGVAEQIGDTRYRSRSLFILGICALFIFEEGSAAALAYFQQSEALARQGDDCWCLVHALAGVAWVRNLQGEPSQARSLLDECLAVARQAGDREALATSMHLLGVVALGQGDLVTAEVVLTEAVVIARTLGDARLIAETLHSLGEVALGQDDLAEARQIFDESLALARSVGARSAAVSACYSLGEVARRAEDLTTARAFLTEAISISWQAGATCTPALVGLSQVSGAMGDPWAAETLLDQALASTTRPGARAAALHQLGILYRARGDVAAARSLHQEAFALWSELHDPLGMAQSLDRFAGIAAIEGNYRQAARLFGAAHALRDGTDFPPPSGVERRWYESDLALARDGMPENFDMVWADGHSLSASEVAVLTSTSPSTGDRPPSGWASLTRAERDVAALVAKNLTNREIGERLRISPRTVQTHLAHAFTKLGFSSRRDLARLVARLHPSLDGDRVGHGDEHSQPHQRSARPGHPGPAA
jgi:predicted ATPase/DNA-binding CsgD family transcriptional regulator